MTVSIFVAVEGFGALADVVREHALSQIEHADLRIIGWRPDGDGVALEVEDGASVHDLEDRVRTMIEETMASFRFFKTETLDEDPGAPTNDKSPFDELVATGQVALIGPGVPVYQGSLARRLDAIDERIKKLAWSRGAIEQLYPTTVATSSLTANGYLTSYPQHALLVTAIHQDIDSLAQAAELAKERTGFEAHVRPFLGMAEEVLAPTVCYRCFDSLRNLPGLARPLGAGRTFTGIANCHRREDKALVELSRLQTFRMREIVFFGAPEFVDEHRQWWIDMFAALLRSWHVRFRFVSASDPFFLSGSAKKRAYQSMRRLKYECQLQIPHSDQWVAVASFNNHEATLVDCYELSGASAEPGLQSGCVGFGFDRLVYALLCQFGCDSQLWPEALRTFFGESEGPDEGGQWRLDAV